MPESSSTPHRRILLVTNMWPSAQMPFGGIFVKNEYDWLKAWSERTHRVEVEVFFMRRRLTSGLGSAAKYCAAAVRFLRRLARTYDVVHIHYAYPLIGLVWLYKAVRPRTVVIATFHGGDIEGRYENGLVRAVFRLFARSIDHAFVVGAHLTEQVRDKLLVDSVEVLSAGVDARVFYHEPVPKQYDFIFIGAFTPGKGIDLLVEALQILGRPDVRVCFVGGGPLGPHIEGTAQSCQLTTMRPQPQDAVRRLLNAARFLVLPSRTEGFGLAVREALFCGTPALVTPVGGLVEQVSHGNNGLVTKDVSTQALVEGMERALALSEAEYAGYVATALASNSPHRLDVVCARLLQAYQA